MWHKSVIASTASMESEFQSLIVQSSLSLYLPVLSLSLSLSLSACVSFCVYVTVYVLIDVCRPLCVGLSVCV